MLRFENRASPYGFRLVGKTEGLTIEIGMHYTATEGDFDVSDRGYHLFKTWDDVVRYITENYGENNLEEFRAKAEELQRKMYKDKYVRKWKGRSRP